MHDAERELRRALAVLEAVLPSLRQKWAWARDAVDRAELGVAFDVVLDALAEDDYPEGAKPAVEHLRRAHDALEQVDYEATWRTVVSRYGK
jgi:hypothetical protein